MTDRKPLIVLAVLAVVAIIVYLVAVVGAGRSDGGETGLPGWAAPDLSPADALTTDDLQGSDGCSFSGQVITFTGGCAVTVRELTDGWPWQHVTRRARLVVTGGPVDLAVTLVGKELSTSLDPGDDIRLTYTREGGSFVVGCGNLGGCSVTLAEDS